jgi:hypothetical protein
MNVNGYLLLRLCVFLLGCHLGGPALAVTSADDLNIGVDDILWTCFLCFMFGLLGFATGHWIKFLRMMVDAAS